MEGFRVDKNWDSFALFEKKTQIDRKWSAPDFKNNFCLKGCKTFYLKSKVHEGSEGSKFGEKIDDVIYEWLQNLIPKMDPKMAYQITTAASSIKG